MKGRMTDLNGYLIDPMASLFAAVTAVENGQVGEIELMFTNESDATNVAMSVSIIVRREVQQCVHLIPNNSKEE
jgi:hypothetical protein